MAATLPAIPAVPDDATLARDIPGRPDWQMITEALDGANGKELYAMNAEGAQAVEELNTLDTQMKRYEKAHDDWYWTSPFGRLRKDCDDIHEALYLAERRRIKTTRERVGEVCGEFEQERENQRKANERRLAEQQRRAAEESKSVALAALEAEKAAAPAEHAAEVQQQIEEVKAAPMVPVSVSKAQAEIGLPSAPSNRTSRKVYIRHFDNRNLKAVKDFAGWLHKNPEYAVTLGLSVSFAKLKNNSMPIPGVAVEEKFESANRNR